MPQRLQTKKLDFSLGHIDYQIDTEHREGRNGRPNPQLPDLISHHLQLFLQGGCLLFLEKLELHLSLDRVSSHLADQH